MNTSEKIASVVAQFIAADREEDRERIAELERDLSHMQLRVDLALSEDDNLTNQLNELTEKCAALVLEKEIARGDLVKLREERDAAADREEDRKRIAELERDFARALVREREAIERTGAAIHRVQSLENGAEWERKDVNATIAALNKQLDELTEKCAALVVERDSLIGQLMDNGWPCRSTGTAEPVETPAAKQEEQGWCIVGDNANRGQHIVYQDFTSNSVTWSRDRGIVFFTEQAAKNMMDFIVIFEKKFTTPNVLNIRVIPVGEAMPLLAKVIE